MFGKNERTLGHRVLPLGSRIPYLSGHQHGIAGQSGTYIELIRNADLPDDANVLWVSHGNTVLSLVERFGHGKYDVTESQANRSLKRATLTDNDMKIVEYNK